MSNEPCKTNKKADPKYPYHSRFGDNGEIIYSVPLEAPIDRTAAEPVEEEDDLRFTYLRFRGGKPVRVHFVEIADREAAYKQKAWLNTEHSRDHRQAKRGALQHEEQEDAARKKKKTVKGGKKQGYVETGFIEVDFADLPGLIAKYIDEKYPQNPLYSKVYLMAVEQIPPEDIAEQLGIKKNAAYDYRKAAYRIAQEYHRLYAHD